MTIGNQIKTDSQLASLNPVLHNGYIRVGGRQQQANADNDPIVLPSKQHFTSSSFRIITS
ncbi:hypothetical protein DPMN_187726 [Dreissena polymorpha]|uniref:Uncharacterized protein n=1 Tax=Dreissena polymorpha TaxID=45954 RepID=A0A9D4DPL6_DREPO|nr:hypothetical protein DPMN_187726 [Dreissena polymorpha]